MKRRHPDLLVTIEPNSLGSTRVQTTSFHTTPYPSLCFVIKPQELMEKDMKQVHKDTYKVFLKHLYVCGLRFGFEFLEQM
jgi:hypothetical protein